MSPDFYNYRTATWQNTSTARDKLRAAFEPEPESTELLLRWRQQHDEMLEKAYQKLRQATEPGEENAPVETSEIEEEGY